MTEENTTNEENLTEVVSVASEEERTGQKIPIPSPEDLVARASSEFYKCQKIIHALLTSKQVSRRQLVRGVMAGLDLPTGGLDVSHLRTNEEKMIFDQIQRLTMSKFTIIHDSIVKQAKAAKEQKQPEESKGDENGEKVP